jgi:ATP-dependent DNA helicase RecG
VISDDLQSSLTRQGLLVSEDGQLRPSGFGILLFGDRPREIFPQAGLVATAVYPSGDEETRDFAGPLVEIPAEVQTWLRPRLPTFIDRTSMERGDAWSSLPFELVREGVVNALVHRDYEITGAKCQLRISPDSVSIMSPGVPVPPITLEQLQAFEAPTLSRNPKIHYVFKQLGLAEEAGFGMETLKAFQSRSTIPTPQFSYRDPYLVLTLFPSAGGAGRAIAGVDDATLSPDERHGWQALADQGSITPRAYADEVGVSPRTAARHLAHLVDLGLARRVGRGRATRYELNTR